MKVLLITPRVPFPPKDGGAIAMYNMAKGLSDNGVNLDLFSYNTSKHYVKDPQNILELNFFDNVNNSFLDNRLSIWSAFQNLFSNKSYNTARFINNQIFNDLKEVIKNNHYDVIQCEVLFGALYAKKIKEISPKSKLVYRAHNVEYRIWERLAEQASGLKKIYLKLMSKRLKKEEQRLLTEFDLVVPISDVDKAWFEVNGAKEVFVSSTGVNDFSMHNRVDEPKVGFLGSLDWEPNVEGVHWFVKNVWPMIYSHNSKAKLNIAGRNCPNSIKELHDIEGVNVIGEVEDAKSFIKSNKVMAVPLLSGSGMRIKIVESLAFSMPIVTTSVGCEGIEVNSGDQLYVKDTPQDFAKAILNLLDDSNLCESISREGFAFCQKNYSNTSIVSKLVNHYSGTLC